MHAFQACAFNHSAISPPNLKFDQPHRPAQPFLVGQNGRDSPPSCPRTPQRGVPTTERLLDIVSVFEAIGAHAKKIGDAELPAVGMVAVCEQPQSFGLAVAKLTDRV